MVYYCQKCHFVNNRSFLFFDYCQKRCFVKNKNSDRNHCLLLSWLSPQTCPKKLIFLYFPNVFLFIKTINNNKSGRLIYTIMFAGGNSSIEKALNDQCFFLVLKWKPFQMKIEVWYNRRKYIY